ncbi:MAG: metallophosphoesterase family protein [Candidatus Limnocylindria bacterium]
MRIAVLADLHANLPALRAVLDDAAALGCDTAWCVGDVVGRGPHPAEVIDELRRLAIPTIQGNWDEAVGLRREHPGVAWTSPEAEAGGLLSLAWTIERTTDEQRSWLRQLPAAHRFTVEGRSVLLFHGSPLRQSEYLWSDRPSRVFARIAADQGDELMCFGNTHEAFHRVVSKSHLVAAGSVGCGTLEDTTARYAVLDMVGAELMVNFRSVAYDHLSVDVAMRAAGLSPSLLWGPAAAHPTAEPEAESLVEA